jgi:hypothetical protein
VKRRCFYVTNKIHDGSRVGLKFVFNIGSGKLLKLAKLIYISKDNSILIVFTPLSKREKVVFEGHLKTDDFVHNYFDAQICEFLEKIISGLLRPEIGVDLVIRELTKSQERDYKDFEYKCYDKVHIPGSIPMRRSNEVKVNSHEIKLGDSVFGLFLRLVLELKKNSSGWVNRHTLDSDGIISDVDKFQIYSNLRTALQRGLLDRDGRKFIENNGSKQYRISLHPDFITYHRKNFSCIQATILENSSKSCLIPSSDGLGHGIDIIPPCS